MGGSHKGMPWGWGWGVEGQATAQMTHSTEGLTVEKKNWPTAVCVSLPCKRFFGSPHGAKSIYKRGYCTVYVYF